MERSKTNVIKTLTFEFAIDVVKLSNQLKSKQEYVLSKQLLRSGTSIGAMVREAQYGESTKDFIHKLSIALKEANETEYWLDLLEATKLIGSEKSKTMKEVNRSILRLLISILKTTKQNL